MLYNVYTVMKVTIPVAIRPKILKILFILSSINWSIRKTNERLFSKGLGYGPYHMHMCWSFALNTGHDASVKTISVSGAYTIKFI